MKRQNYDFGPLFGSTVGFDRVFDCCRTQHGASSKATSIPPMTSSALARMLLHHARSRGVPRGRADDHRRAKPVVRRGRASRGQGVRSTAGVPAPWHRGGARSSIVSSLLTMSAFRNLRAKSADLKNMRSQYVCSMPIVQHFEITEIQLFFR